MDAAFTEIRQSGSQEARVKAAEEVNRLFAENVWNLWTTWTLWGVAANPRIQSLTDLELPTGGTSMPVIAGKHHLTQIWCLDGDCQG